MLQTLGFLWGQDFGHIVVDGRDGSHVLLVFRDVELVGKVALFEFSELKSFGKRREGHLEETEGIDETHDVVADHLQKFTPLADLFDLLVVGVVLVHHEIPIVLREIMGDDIDGTRLVQGQGIQPFEKLLHALVSLEAKGSRVVFGFGNDQIGHMIILGLYGFDVEEHVHRWGKLVRHRPQHHHHHHHHCFLPHWPAGFGGQRQPLVWQVDLVDAGVFVCVSFSALGFLEG